MGDTNRTKQPPDYKMRDNEECGELHLDHCYSSQRPEFDPHDTSQSTTTPRDSPSLPMPDRHSTTPPLLEHEPQTQDLTDIEQGIMTINDYQQTKTSTTKEPRTQVTYENEKSGSLTPLPPLTEGEASKTSSEEDQPPDTRR